MSVTTRELATIDSVLGMGGGYVLDFSDRTFALFFEEHGLDLNHPRYATGGPSKAKRLRAFLRAGEPAQVARILHALLEHGHPKSAGSGRADIDSYRKIIARLGGGLSVSEVTRRNLFDELRLSSIRWAGRLPEKDFLSRIFNLNDLPSSDPRYADFVTDLWQHRERNSDWPDEWVFSDSRLDLLRGKDETLLRFLCEMVHPVVRPERSEVDNLVTAINRHLRVDGWEIAATSQVSGKPVYSPRRRATGRVELSPSESPKDVLSDEYVRELAIKCDARLGNDDFEGAITTGRTMLEAVLVEIEVRLTGTRGDHKGDLPKQFKQVAKLLRMDDQRADLDDRFKDVVRGLVSVVNGLAPLRNKLSDGHARVRRPAPHHAHLVVDTAKTVVKFLIESYLVQTAKRSLVPVPTEHAT